MFDIRVNCEGSMVGLDYLRACGLGVVGIARRASECVSVG